MWRRLNPASAHHQSADHLKILASLGSPALAAIGMIAPTANFANAARILTRFSRFKQEFSAPTMNNALKQLEMFFGEVQYGKEVGFGSLVR